MKFILIPLLLWPFLQSRAQLSFNQFHGPAALATGNTYATLSGCQAAYGNPALLLGHPGWSANLSVQNQYEIPELTVFQGSIIFSREKIGGFGLSLLQLGSGSYRDQGISFSYARPLLSNLNLGIQFDWWHTSIAGYPSINQFTVEIGMLYLLSPSISLGLHLFNPFHQRYHYGRVLPTFMTLGLQYQLTDYLVLVAEVEKDIYRPARIKAGIRYGLFDNFNLSAGFFTTERSPNLTAGVHYQLRQHLRIDLAIQYHQWLGICSALGIDYYLGKKKEN
jgi:hypothetical protein